MNGGDDGAGSTSLTIDSPTESCRDERIAIRIEGADPGETVEFRASITDPGGVEWQSSATFTADAGGAVDLTAHSPDTGSYDGVAPMGWLWSMTATADAYVTRLRQADRAVVELLATAGTQRAERTTTRRLIGPGVKRHPVESERVAGTLFEPPGPGPHPGVLALHGSGGDPQEDIAALLADRGFATLALRYFGDPDPIPDELTRVPLSYFVGAASWLRDRGSVRGGQVGVIGTSRGGELALLLGSRFDWVGAVVSYVGSGVAYNTPHGPAAWTEDGEAVPHVRATEVHEQPDDDGTAAMLERALDAADDATLRAATIPVEETDGPVLLVSGGDDPVWPSRRLSRIAVDRLRTADFSHRFQHLTYDDAGHYITPPYLPKAEPLFGGTPAGMARADVDAWPTAVDFLDAGLGTGPADGGGIDA